MSFNTLRSRQKGHRFANDTFKHIFLNENVRITIEISLKFVAKGRINNNPALLQIMVWRRPGDKPLSEPMMVYWRIYVSLGLIELRISPCTLMILLWFWNAFTILAICKGNSPVDDGLTYQSACNANQIARYMGLTWDPAGDDRTKVGPMLASWTLLSGNVWNAVCSKHRRDTS